MLSWPRTSRRLDMLVEQIAAMAEELASLRAALAGERERARAAEEKLLGQVSVAEELRQQLRQVHEQVDELVRSHGEQGERLRQLDSPERLDRLEQLDKEREADGRRMGLILAKLEQRIDQQAQDAATTAAVLLERVQASR